LPWWLPPAVGTIRLQALRVIAESSVGRKVSRTLRHVSSGPGRGSAGQGQAGFDRWTFMMATGHLASVPAPTGIAPLAVGRGSEYRHECWVRFLLCTEEPHLPVTRLVVMPTGSALAFP
jgi:hypothetical protein